MSAPLRFCLSAEERLRGSSQIRAVFKKGKSYSCPEARLIVKKNSLSYNRFLCTFRRGYGTAVVRNRAVRLSKEAYRCVKHSVLSGYDMILLVSSYGDTTFTRKNQLLFLLKKARLYCGS